MRGTEKERERGREDREERKEKERERVLWLKCANYTLLIR